jgi:hypothetical protein
VLLPRLHKDPICPATRKERGRGRRERGAVV